MSSCCTISSSRSEPDLISCPSCGSKGRQVSLATVGAMVRTEVETSRLSDPSYRLCPNASCDVVYFGAIGSVLNKADMRVAVGFKEKADHIPVCYCFGHSRGSIFKEIHQTGRSTVREQITREVKAGRCACEVKNPAGTCCLGDVGRVVKAALAQFACLK